MSETRGLEYATRYFLAPSLVVLRLFLGKFDCIPSILDILQGEDGDTRFPDLQELYISESSNEMDSHGTSIAELVELLPSPTSFEVLDHGQVNEMMLRFTSFARRSGLQCTRRWPCLSTLTIETTEKVALDMLSCRAPESCRRKLITTQNIFDQLKEYSCDKDGDLGKSDSDEAFGSLSALYNVEIRK